MPCVAATASMENSHTAGHPRRAEHPPHRVKPLAPAVGTRALLQQRQLGQRLGGHRLVRTAPAPGAADSSRRGCTPAPRLRASATAPAHPGPVGHLLRCACVKAASKVVSANRKGRVCVSMCTTMSGVRLRQLRQAQDEPTRGERGHRRQRQRAALALVGHHVQRVALQPCSQRAHLAAVVAPAASAPRRGVCGETAARPKTLPAPGSGATPALCVSEQLLRGAV